MMLYPAADPSSKHQQQPLPIKRRRGRPPKDLTAENSPSELSNGIFATSPLALNSAAALRVGSPETTSPLMRVSPDKRKRNSTSRVVQTGPKGKRTKSSFVEYTPTKPSPLSSKKDGEFISMLPPLSKTHQKLSEITGKKLKNQQPQPQQQQQQQPQPTTTTTTVDQSAKFAKPQLSTPNPNKYQIDNGLMLSSPLTNLQQPSTFAKQHDNNSDMIFGPGNVPLTPASQFTSMIHSSPIYQNYYGESLTPLVGKKIFNFESTFGRLEEEQFNPMPSTQRTNSLTIIDTIGRNISTSSKNDLLYSSSPFQQLVSSPRRPDEFIKKSFSTTTLPLSSMATAARSSSLGNEKPMVKRNFKISLKIGSDGKASITREEQTDEIEETPIIQQPPIKATPRQTIRPSLMTLSSSPALLNKDNTINNLKSIILNDGDNDSEEEEEEEEEEDIIINRGESDARSALMRAFRRMV